MRTARLLLGAVLFLLAKAPTAHAYPWMIRHGHAQCVSCHADPAGGGLLNPYGRAQGELLMRMPYGLPPDREPGRWAEPLGGIFELPTSVLVGGDIRFANVRMMPDEGDAQSRFILFQADALAEWSVGPVRANGSIGFVSEGANGAAITRGTSMDEKLVSRHHWIGIDLGSHDQWLLRAGRMNVPFGLRSIEHTLFVRAATRTDINASQTYGVEADYHDGPLRAGGMLIAGNFAVSPDHFRSRGYAAFAEYALVPTAAVGVSSMITHARLDLVYLTPAFRHAHGAFFRYSPLRLAVLSGEWDFLFVSQPTPDTNTFGGAGMLMLDLEPLQGLHVGSTYELDGHDFGGPKSHGFWLSAWWFFLPHADARVDLIRQSLGNPAGAAHLLTLVAQVHVYL
jgi:hypothetical protein